VAFIAHGVLTGTFFTATASLGQRLFPATKFAQFASAAGILGALGYFVLPPATGLWLDLTGHVYRHTFTASGLLALLALGAFAKVYQNYRALGGDVAWHRVRHRGHSPAAGRGSHPPAET
jgi:MFS family permease